MLGEYSYDVANLESFAWLPRSTDGKYNMFSESNLALKFNEYYDVLRKKYEEVPPYLLDLLTLGIEVGMLGQMVEEIQEDEVEHPSLARYLTRESINHLQFGPKNGSKSKSADKKVQYNNSFRRRISDFIGSALIGFESDFPAEYEYFTPDYELDAGQAGTFELKPFALLRSIDISGGEESETFLDAGKLILVLKGLTKHMHEKGLEEYSLKDLVSLSGSFILGKGWMEPDEIARIKESIFDLLIPEKNEASQLQSQKN